MGELNLKTFISDFYKKDFGPPEPNFLSLDEEKVDDIDRVSVEENDILIAPFSKEEVFEAISQMKRNTAPGPDGFPTEFYQLCWPVIKKI